MKTVTDRVQDYLAKVGADEDWLREKAHTFSREGFVKIGEIMPKDVIDLMREEAVRLADKHSTNWDSKLKTTDYTPRKMDVVQSESMWNDSKLITSIYTLSELRDVLEKIADAPILDCPALDEQLFLTRQRKAGDTHGWHWGDFTYAMVWVLVAPPVEFGGMLQCVPHTSWNKNNPRVNRSICENKISTYSFESGDIYFLKTDTTLHRTVPLTKDATRVMLNMTWAGHTDFKKDVLQGEDVWWIDNPDPDRVAVAASN